MSNKELMPGVEIEDEEAMQAELLKKELEDARRQIANKKTQTAEEIEARKKVIMEAVENQLSRGNEVRITEEMVELGLDREVRGMQLSADARWKIMRHLVDDDDDFPEPHPYDYLGS